MSWKEEFAELNDRAFRKKSQKYMINTSEPLSESFDISSEVIRNNLPPVLTSQAAEFLGLPSDEEGTLYLNQTDISSYDSVFIIGNEIGESEDFDQGSIGNLMGSWIADRYGNSDSSVEYINLFGRIGEHLTAEAEDASVSRKRRDSLFSSDKLREADDLIDVDKFERVDGDMYDMIENVFEQYPDLMRASGIDKIIEPLQQYAAQQAVDSFREQYPESEFSEVLDSRDLLSMSPEDVKDLFGYREHLNEVTHRFVY